MRPHLPLQRRRQLSQFAAQTAARQFRQHRWVLLAFHQRLDHQTARHAQGVRYNAIQLHIGVFQHFADAVAHLHAFAHQRGTHAAQVAQLAHLQRRHETGFQQPVPQQVRQPRAVGLVGLAARHLPDVTGIDQNQLATGFQNVEHRLPVHAGRFHRCVRDAFLLEPLHQLPQLARGGAELPDLFVRIGAGAWREHAHHHRFLMHIHACASRLQNFHGPLLCWRTGNARKRALSLACWR